MTTRVARRYRVVDVVSGVDREHLALILAALSHAGDSHERSELITSGDCAAIVPAGSPLPLARGRAATGLAVVGQMPAGPLRSSIGQGYPQHVPDEPAERCGDEDRGTELSGSAPRVETTSNHASPRRCPPDSGRSEREEDREGDPCDDFAPACSRGAEDSRGPSEVEQTVIAQH